MLDSYRKPAPVAGFFVIVIQTIKMIREESLLWKNYPPPSYIALLS